MKKWMLFLPLLFLGCTKEPKYSFVPSTKNRVILLTDILNEADDSQTLGRFLMYANKMDIEGIIAVSSCHQYKGKNDPNPDRNTVHPDEIKKYIRAYGEILSNLIQHEKGWPSANYLLSITGAGHEGFGMRDVKAGNSTSGSEIIIKALKKKDDRPLYVVVNGGANCLAQALIDLQARCCNDSLNVYLKKLRVWDNAGQDNAGAWIAHTFPDLFYRRSSYQVYNFMNNDGPANWPPAEYPGKGQYLWAHENIQLHHGPLGELYPTRMKWKDPHTYSTIEGGGSGNFIGFVNLGLSNPEKLEWGGWIGRFDTIKVENIYGNQLKWAEPELFQSEQDYKPYYMFPEVAESWTDEVTEEKYSGPGVPLFRWRRAYQNDFAARMDWCVSPFSKANHNPVAVIENDTTNAFLFVASKCGAKLKFDASSSFDPDGDSLKFNWFVYPEAGNYDGAIKLNGINTPKVEILVPDDANNKNIHLILEVSDKNNISLTDYRRIILNIN